MSKSSQQYYEHSREFEKVEDMERAYILEVEEEEYLNQKNNNYGNYNIIKKSNF